VAAPEAYRYRITFTKTEAMRFTGHLDLHRAWERTFRRADLPLAYSQGFSPHPRIQLAAALPLGMLGEAELLDVWLEQAIDPGELLDRSRRAAPPGIGVIDVQVADLEEASLQQRVEAAVFEATPGETISPADLDIRIAQLVSQESIERQRRGKTYDLRPLILEIEAGGDPASAPSLRMTLTARASATGRPEEVMAALNLDPAAARITRRKLLLAPSAA
jgi:radical SAM-linked protein